MDLSVAGSNLRIRTARAVIIVESLFQRSLRSRQFQDAIMRSVFSYSSRQKLGGQFILFLWASPQLVRMGAFLLWARYDLWRIKRQLNLMHAHISSFPSFTDETRSRAVDVASSWGDMAKRLYRLADRDREMIEQFRGFDHFWFVHLMMLSYRKLAQWHEEVGCVAEDAAETLALGSSTEFTDLVRRETTEIHAQP